MPEAYHLVIQQGPGQGQMYAIDRDELVIGRGIDSDLSIIEPSLSRRHARLFQKDGRFYLEDLKSTNGTWLNDMRLTSAQPVEPGTRFRLGQTVVLSFDKASAEEGEKTMTFAPDILKMAVGPPAKEDTDLTASGSKVFISYSRRNKEFVQKLHGGLRATGMNVWVDWEGIPLTADWWQEIQDAIEGADGFIFVISPDSLASEVCAKELQTAIDSNKRLIPVLHIDLEKDTQIPEQISSHNWVFMKNDDELQQNLPALIESINTDLDWVRSHTRLLVRAVEWEKSNKNKSFLLQGDDLQNAESWLQNAANNQPPATKLHLEYIQASRNSANRRQRTVVIASMSAVVVTLVLAIAAVIFMFRALDAEDVAQIAATNAIAAEGTAVKEAATSSAAQATAEIAKFDAENQKSTAEAALLEVEAALQEVQAAQTQAAARTNDLLASKALSFAGTDPVLAVLLALEAQKASSNHATALEALAVVPAYYPPLIDTFIPPNPNGYISALAWSPSGVLAAALAGDTDFPILLWNRDTHEPDLVLSGHQSLITAIAWSDRGELASASDDGTVILWDLDAGEPAIVFPNYQSYISDLAWSHTGRLASSDYYGGIVLWDLVRKDAETILYYEAGVNAIAFGPFGQLASGAEDASVQIWNISTETIDAIYRDHTSSISSLAFSPDGLLASGSNDATVVVRNPFGGAPVVLQGHLDYVTDVAWSDDGRLASGSWDKNVIIWDIDRKIPHQTLRSHNSAISDIDWGLDGLLASGAEFLHIWDLDRDPTLTRYEGHQDWIESLAWTEDGQLVSSSLDGSAIFWDAATGEMAEDYPGGGGFDMYGTLLLSRWTLIDRSTDFTVDLPFYSGTFSPDGTQILSEGLESGLIVIWDVESILTEDIPISRTLAVDSDIYFTNAVWSPDGRAVATGSEDGVVMLLDLATGDVEELYRHDSPVSALGWNPNGILASAGCSGNSSIILYDPAGRETLTTIFGSDNECFKDLAWGPNGELATATDKGMVTIWDIENAKPAAAVRWPSLRSVNTIAWNPDGTRLAFGGEDFFVYVFNTWYAQPPCNWLTRNLTEYEWLLYLPAGSEYASTCTNLPVGQMRTGQ